MSSTTSANDRKTADWIEKHSVEQQPLVDMSSKPSAQTAPTATVSEVDELDGPTSDQPYPGIDDGFFAPAIPKSAIPEDAHRYAPRHPQLPFPYAPGYTPHDLETAIITDLETIPDVNQYQHKKTLAQGMMDLALFSANANQLRYVLESYDRHPYYYPSLALISCSILLQIAIGLGLILNSRYNVKDDKEICVANKINNYTIIGIFLVTAFNVFISAFGVANVQVAVQPTLPP